MQNVLVIGIGEIGLPIYELLKEGNSLYHVYKLDLDPKKTDSHIPKKIDIMHICILCQDVQKFKKIVVDYYNTYNPELIVINSTMIPTGTSDIAQELPRKVRVVYSPTFGTHYSKDQMKAQIKNYVHLIGGIDHASIEIAKLHFRSVGWKYKVMTSPLEAEIMKTMETTYAGWMITFFVEFHRLCEEFGASFEEIMEAMSATYEPNCNKPIWYPDVIRGHCIMQNIDLLLEVYDGDFLKLIKKSNELRKKELGADPNLWKVIEGLKKLKKP